MTDEAIQKYSAIVEEQEQKLRFSKLDQDDAFDLGLTVMKTAKEKYGSPVSLRIDIDGFTVFFHMMQGVTLENAYWMQKKLNACLQTENCSMMHFFKADGGKRANVYPWAKDEGNFTLIGGCFPLRLSDGRLKGYIAVSGLPHQKDHQLLADSLGAYLNVAVPTVLDGGWDFE